MVKEETSPTDVMREGSADSEVAPVIGQWTEACFSVGSPSSEADVRELLQEAAK